MWQQVTQSGPIICLQDHCGAAGCVSKCSLAPQLKGPVICGELEKHIHYVQGTNSSLVFPAGKNIVEHFYLKGSLSPYHKVGLQWFGETLEVLHGKRKPWANLLGMIQYSSHMRYLGEIVQWLDSENDEHRERLSWSLEGTPRLWWASLETSSLELGQTLPSNILV